MNRKALLFIIFMLSILSIMAIGVWGASPDPSDSITVTSIYFDDNRIITNDSGNKIIFVEDIITDTSSNSTMQIDFVIVPNNASSHIIARTNEDTVSATVSGNSIIVAFTQRITVSITITDRKTEKSDTVTLVFRAPGQVDVPDDIFG